MGFLIAFSALPHVYYPDRLPLTEEFLVSLQFEISPLKYFFQKSFT